MRTIRMASPLYILREECARDLRGVLGKLKALGFDGVELLGLFGHDFLELEKWGKELGLLYLGDHVPLSRLESEGRPLLRSYTELGCEYLTVSEVPLEDVLRGEKALYERLRALIAMAREEGLTLQYHNHDQELIEKAGGVEALQLLMDELAGDGLCLELDLGWAEIGGADCKKYLTRYRASCPVLHLKDYYSSDNTKLGRVRDFVPARGTAERGHFEFRPTGYGVLDLPALMPLCLACDPKWLVMDHDLSYERDPYEDLKWSLDYTRRLLAVCDI